MLEFHVGDKAVYPAQGVAEVVGIDQKEISGKIQNFYVLRLLDSDMRILVPIEKAAQVGLREVVQEGRRFERLDTEQRHGVRKRLKRLRYLAEMVRPLYPARDVDRFVAGRKHELQTLSPGTVSVDWSSAVVPTVMPASLCLLSSRIDLRSHA